VVAFGDPGIGDERSSYVENDYPDAMAQAVEHLASLGHERIGYVSGLAVSHRADGRIEGFRKAMSRRLPESRPVVVAPRRNSLTGFEDGDRLARRALREHPRLTALVLTNDLMAAGAMRALRALGVAVPGDVSIVGIDNAYLGELLTPPLTTLAADYTRIGGQAFGMLRAAIDRGEQRSITNTLQLLVRDSTTEARRGD
jgi:LacI family transcriptional regulator